MSQLVVVNVKANVRLFRAFRVSLIRLLRKSLGSKQISLTKVDVNFARPQREEKSFRIRKIRRFCANDSPILDSIIVICKMDTNYQTFFKDMCIYIRNQYICGLIEK